MPLKRASSDELSSTITSDDVLGKEVIDSEGELIGVVEMLHLDPNAVEVVGITVDKGFLRTGLVIGKEYIERVASHAVFLKIRPAFKLKGMTVYDSNGDKIGIVSRVILKEDKNIIDSLIVQSSAIARELVIPSSIIKTIGDNVLLSEEKANLRAS